MTLEENIVPLGKFEALPKIKEKIGGYMRNASAIYVGVSSNPNNRALKHAEGGWERMVLLYEAFTADIAHELETELIAWVKTRNFLTQPANIGAGGEGISQDRHPYYVYILLKPR